MKKIDWFLIGLSVCFYAIPFIGPECLWWLIFLFPMPLLYGAGLQSYSFFEGFIWAFLSLLIHGHGGISVLGHMAHTGYSGGIFLGVCIAACYGAIIGLLFLCGRWIALVLRCNAPWQRVIIFTGVLVISIMWIDQYCFILFGRWEGYPLMHPLLVCTYHPMIRMLMPVLGKYCMTLLFFLFGAVITLLGFYRVRVVFWWCVGMIIIWYASVMIVTDECNSSFQLERFVALPMMTVCSLNSQRAIHQLSTSLRSCLERHENADVIIMPESAYSYDIFAPMEKDNMLSAEHVGKPVHLIVGVGDSSESCSYNRLYWIHNGVIRARFEKRHTMIVSERLPVYMGWPFLQQMYRSPGQSDVVSATNERIIIDLCDTCCYVPYICSELFFNEYPDDDYVHMPIIAVVNDSIFGSCGAAYIQRLLALLAYSKAILWQRDIVYVSYSRALFLGKDGCMMQLQQ